jgi:fatty-acid desaturase
MYDRDYGTSPIQRKPIVNNLSWNWKLKFWQGIAFFGGPLVIIFNFNLEYLFYAWLYSWIVVHLGISVVMHRGFAHRSWVPKNNFINIICHILSTINAVGSAIAWCGTHRTHHRHSDTDLDPHKIKDSGLIAKIKYWFNYLPSHNVPLNVVRDLAKDPYHRFFHRHYFKILIVYQIILLSISFDVYLYGFIVATMFSLHTISWITVGAHIFGNKTEHTGDESRNTLIMGYYMWGEGWHNNHHKKPWSYEFGWNAKQLDIGKHVIKLIAKPESLKNA